MYGEYSQYECGLSVGAATAADTGEWACEVEAYISVSNTLSSSSPT